MKRIINKVLCLLLITEMISLSCACHYSLISFRSLEEGMAYYQRDAEIEKVIEGANTIFVVYQFSGGRGYIVFSEADGVYRRVSCMPLSSQITEDCSIHIYEFSYSDDKYIYVELVNRDSKYNVLEVSNDYDWPFEQLTFKQPWIYISVAGFSAEQGDYFITINGDVVKFELH